MKKRSKDAVRAVIGALDIPPWVIEVFDGHYPSEALRYRFGCPDELFLMTEDELAIWPDAWVVVLDDGSFGTLFAYDEVRRGFVSFDVEDADVRADMPLHSWVALMVPVALSFLEDTDAWRTDEEAIVWLREILGIPMAAEMVASFPREGFPTFDEAEAWTKHWERRLDRPRAEGLE